MKVIKGLAEYCESNGIANITSLVGSIIQS
jgi:hypothetical protein